MGHPTTDPIPTLHEEERHDPCVASRTMVFRLLVVAAVLSMLVAVVPPPAVPSLLPRRARQRLATRPELRSMSS